MVKKRKKSNLLSNLLIVFNLSLLFILVFLLVYYSPEIIRVFSKEKQIKQDKTTMIMVSTLQNKKEDQKIKVDTTPSTTGGQKHGLYLREEDSTIDKQTNKNGPKITKGVIDPNDLCPGATQTMTIYVEDEKYETISVIAEIKNDKGTVKKELKLKSGTKKKGVWEGEWLVRDVHKTTYNTKFIATNSKGEEGEIIISWTDACDCFSGTLYNTSSPCYEAFGCQGWSGGIETGSPCSVVIDNGMQWSYGSYLKFLAPVTINNGGILKSACP